MVSPRNLDYFAQERIPLDGFKCFYQLNLNTNILKSKNIHDLCRLITNINLLFYQYPQKKTGGVPYISDQI